VKPFPILKFHSSYCCC